MHRREQLLRYLLRPPLSADRLSLASGGRGRVRLALKTPWRDGTTALLLHPTDLLARLAALVCPPRANQVLYSGVLAANAAWRKRVVPEPPAAPSPPADTAPAANAPNTDAPAPAPTRPNPNWATLMQRGLDLDVLTCPNCGGRLRHIASILRRDVIRRILDHLGLRSDPPTVAPARTLPLFEPADWA